MENTIYIANLIVKKIKGTISSKELMTLDKWLMESSENRSVYDKANNSKALINKLDVYKLFNKQKAWSKLEDELFNEKTILLNSNRWFRYAAAILLPLLITTSVAYFYLKPEPATLASIDTFITPGIQKAVLVLSDGGTVNLEKSSEFTQIKDADVNIINENNSLVYTSEGKKSKLKELAYNLLKTPRGGGYSLVLADGTEVWLNAGSSLKFPVEFKDSTRHVFLEGEAYFQVSHNGKPFIVSSNKVDVRVLGTSFNVSAYADEDLVKTTLVEGKVKVSSLSENGVSISSKILTPNKQAVISQTDTTFKIAQVNTSQFTSWVYGKLEYSNENLDQVMKSLARWYDFEYQFENNEARNYHFSARINNTENISTILEMLEMTTKVKFEIKENTIVIN